MKRRPKGEVYGFIFWLFTIVFMILYLFWSILPSHMLHSIGFTYYPNKYWALVIPCNVCIVWASYVLGNYFLYHWNVRPLHSREMFCIANWNQVLPHQAPENEECKPNLAPIYDIPSEEVNEKLFRIK